MILWLFFVFFEVAITAGMFGVMGSFGSQFSAGNFRIFGGLALVYPIALIVLTYRFYRSKKFTLREAEIGVASVLLFLLLLILQFVFFSKGVIGEAIVMKLKPYLGAFGISVLALLGSFVCVITIKNEDIIAWLKGVDTTKAKGVFKTSLHKIAQGLMHKILSPLGSKIKQRCQKLKEREEKDLPPPIELDYIQEEKTKAIQENCIEMQLEEINMDDLRDLPTYSQKNKEEIVFDDDIEIQEYVITHKNEKKTSNIKVLDDVPPPTPKTNPFSYDELIKHRSSSISSSMELKEKIKGKLAQRSIVQEGMQEPKIQEEGKTLKSKPSLKPLTPKITPTPLKNNPIAMLAKREQALQSTPIQEENQNNQDEFFEQEEVLEYEERVEEVFVPEIQAPQTPKTQEPQVEEFDTQEPQEVYQDDFFSSEKAEEEKFIPEVISAPKEYTSAFEITPKPTRETPQYSNSPFFNTRTPKVSSLAENEALLSEIDKGEREAPKNYELPPLSLLSPAPEQAEVEFNEEEIDEKIGSLLEKLSVFKIDGDVTRTYSGPIITTLEFRPAPNVKVSRIQSLENDIAMALEAKSIRIQAPIPGKSVVGIEIPNNTIQTIYLREIFESEIFKNSASPLTLALGKDVVGNPFVTDLKKLPHLLIAGTTGSGKSVGVNAMILSLLYRNSPEDLKLMMVDPKMVEFMPYTDLPHLITPIITDPKKAVIGLANAVKEMERRYTLMSQSRTKEIVSYNQKAEELGMEKFPYFVIIIDELADLMMTAGKEVEYSMARIAQMGRASGMHLIVATQSPRAEVLTGLIKTNLPAHLSYKVGTKIDASIIGCPGAETLLGRGDMLFTPPGVSGLVRLHAPWSSEDEVNEIVSYIKEQREVMYDPLFSPEERESLGAMDVGELDSESAELVDRAKEIILQDGKTSISYLQRRLGIGYNKAADIIETLERVGFLSAPNPKGAREILG